jgi:hypothetical protein
MTATILEAQFDFLCRADDRLGQMHLIHYARKHGIDLGCVYGFAGLCAVLPVTDCGNGRFDFRDTADDVEAFVCQALGLDGETCIDLIAWPTTNPRHIMTMFGRAVLVGEWAARSAFTYSFNRPLTLYRTPLEWLQADCNGAAIVDPAKAGRVMADLPGRIAARDAKHGRELSALIDAAFPKDRVLVPANAGRAAA